MNSMDELQKRDRPALESRMFEQMAESFINQWAPRDHRDRAEFCAQLFTILRRLTIDVQEPLARQFGAAMSRMPMFIPTKESAK